jgi:hypothetical protein
MLCRKTGAVCPEILTQHINTLCGQSVEIMSVKPGSACSEHWDIQGADKSLARPERKQATATKDFEFHISCL